MPAEAGLNRSLPRAGGYLLKSNRKLRPEFFRNRAGCAIAVVILKHEPVCDRRDLRRVFRLSGDFRQRLGGIIVSILTTFIRRKINMPEAIAAWQGEFVGVLLEPGFHLCG